MDTIYSLIHNHLPNFIIFCPFWGILQPILVVSLLSLTLFLSVLITGANRINQKWSKIKLGLFELIPEISAQYLLWGRVIDFFLLALGVNGQLVVVLMVLLLLLVVESRIL